MILYAKLDNIKVIYVLKSKRQAGIVRDFIFEIGKVIDKSKVYYMEKKTKKELIKEYVEQGFEVLEVKIGDNYDSYDFYLPMPDKNFIIRGFLY